MSDSKPVRRRKIAGERRPGAAQPHRDKAPAASDAAGSSIPEAPAALAPAAPRADDLPSRPIPNWLLGGLAVLLVVAVAYDLIIGFRSHTATAQRTTQSAAITAALDQAPTEAETAATHILAYDYKTLQHDADEAKSYMTPDYAQQFQRTVDGLLKDPADQVEGPCRGRGQGVGRGVRDAREGRRDDVHRPDEYDDRPSRAADLPQPGRLHDGPGR